MKNLKIYLLAVLAMSFYACEPTDDEGIQDVEAPVFVEVTRPRNAGDGVIEVRGEKAEVRSEGSTHFHVRGTVTDNVGLARVLVDVHSVHDGHSHGRMAALPMYDVDYVIELDGETEFTFDDEHFTDRVLYYGDDNFRAGPYDVILHAVDQASNQTSFQDGSSVLRQIYLRRPYQPAIDLVGDFEQTEDELEFEPGDEFAIDGFVTQRRGAGELAFDVTFIRLSISDDDHGHEHRRDGDVEWEAYWGTSMYLTSSSGAALAGSAIPAFGGDNTLSFEELLADISLTMTEDLDHKILRIEVEDAGGNLAIREFELEVHD